MPDLKRPAKKGTAARWLQDRLEWNGDQCLTWPFSRQPSGYGALGFQGEMYYAHRFMCELFNGPPPAPDYQCAHSCGHGKDGCVHPRHLSWKTLSGNMLDKRQHGTTATGRNPKLTPAQVLKIREEPNAVGIVPTLAEKYGVTESNIRHIRAGRSWRNVKAA